MIGEILGIRATPSEDTTLDESSRNMLIGQIACEVCCCDDVRGLRTCLLLRRQGLLPRKRAQEHFTHRALESAAARHDEALVEALDDPAKLFVVVDDRDVVRAISGGRAMRTLSVHPDVLGSGVDIVLEKFDTSSPIHVLWRERRPSTTAASGLDACCRYTLYWTPPLWVLVVDCR